MSLSSSIVYVNEPGVIAYNVTWEYLLPMFTKIFSASEAVYFHKNNFKLTVCYFNILF